MLLVLYVFGRICVSFNVSLVIIYSAWPDFSGVSVAAALMAEDAEHFFFFFCVFLDHLNCI